MTTPTHYADISDTTIWRVQFTPPAGMSNSEIEQWLQENWADPDAPGIEQKDIYDDGGTEVVFVNTINPTE